MQGCDAHDGVERSGIELEQVSLNEYQPRSRRELAIQASVNRGYVVPLSREPKGKVPIAAPNLENAAPSIQQRLDESARLFRRDRIHYDWTQSITRRNVVWAHDLQQLLARGVFTAARE